MMGRFTALVRETFRDAEAARDPAGVVSSKTLITCIVVCLSLALSKYWGGNAAFYSFFRFIGLSDWLASLSAPDVRLYTLLWWAAIVISFYLIIPALLIQFIFREKITDYGVKLKGALEYRQLYLIMLLIMIPVLVIVSFSPAFQSKYPFFMPGADEPLFPRLVIWEVAYLLQFLALEFFFRGFMLHATKKTLGFYSIFVMIIPYCMIHFNKPLAETLAAVVAGFVLGVLSLRSRSIWLGVAIHGTVAVGMDVLSLWQKGRLPF